MKKECETLRSGSALLVVLGMISFMLFSGLAFSVYMRQSRLPTSFLRRTVASRQLAKAALVEAIDEIDKAIGNDPHPNMFITSESRSESMKSRDKKGGIDGINIWTHRVFFYTGTNTTDEISEYDRKYNGYTPHYESSDDTVPTLTLEGLAYVPPNLINEVRYYSRQTPTAKWHPFWFDSGRYAYTAIDVSDYFDINRVYADVPRASCASRRITLAHLFDQLQVSEGNDNALIVDGAGEGSGAKKWDEFWDKYRLFKANGDDGDGDRPIISLADFNVNWGSDSFTFGDTSCKSPFRTFLEDGSEALYRGGSANKEHFGRLTFVTDSWYPTPANNTFEDSQKNKKKRVDLCGSQPFAPSELETSNLSFEDVIKSKARSLPDNVSQVSLRNHLCLLGLAQLWDYLDADSLPLSLAIPTLERTPMIVGMQIKQLPKLSFSWSKGTEELSNKNDPYKTYTKVEWYKRADEYKLAVDKRLVVHALAAYPFRQHGIDEKLSSFSVDGNVKIFFSPDGQDVRLRPSSGEALRLEKSKIDKCEIQNECAISIALKAQKVKDVSSENKPEDYVQKFEMQGSDAIEAQTVLTVTYEWPYRYWDPSLNNGAGDWVRTDIKPEDDPQQWLSASGKNECKLMALTSDGAKDTGTYGGTGLLTALKNTTPINWHVNAAVWLRVTLGGDTVDLVPACGYDDDEFNGLSSTTLSKMDGIYPLLRFDVKAGSGSGGAETIPFSIDGLKDKEYELTASTPTIFANDPRYNHAPEDWCSASSATTDIEPKSWIDQLNGVLGSGGRDTDIFMFTSDQCILQSPYELAFLPRLTDLTKNSFGNGPREIWGYYSTEFGDRTSLPTKFSETVHNNIMWQTYRCFPTGGEPADPFDDIGYVCGDMGPKVNPYSDDNRILMAAFANTPHDWRVATTNNDDVVDMTGEKFNKAHAWNEYSDSEAKGRISWDCLSEVAETFNSKVHSVDYFGNWEDAFADLGWNASSERKLIGDDELDSEDSDLYLVDKKFLYGFWHDSFAARQQLFLIFVRAEPMMMGGGVSGQIPPQLSTRAVALVWRDPSDTTSTRNTTYSSGLTETTTAPHRTRVLFYHQFE